jgi:hypothetical protein
MKTNFELVKNESLSISKENQKKSQFLSVILPEDFQENAYIRVELINSKIQINNKK